MTTWTQIEEEFEAVLAQGRETLEAAAELAVKYIGRTIQGGEVVTFAMIAELTTAAGISRTRLFERINEINGVEIPEPEMLTYGQRVEKIAGSVRRIEKGLPTKMKIADAEELRAAVQQLNAATISLWGITKGYPLSYSSKPDVDEEMTG